MLIQNQHVAHGKNHHAIMLESHPLPVPLPFLPSPLEMNKPICPWANHYP